MKGNSKPRSLLMEGMKKTNGCSQKGIGRIKRLNVASLNSHLICVLCSGYYVEATAIVECLHTFCRSCIVKYLQSNRFCPICDVQIHEAKPWSSLRPDKTLQNLVYKLVPGLYHDEMRRRRQFYSCLGKESEIQTDEEGGFMPQGARFFSQDDSISLSLEYYNGFEIEEEEEDDEKKENEVTNNHKLKEVNDKPKRYLQCPAAVTVRHLKKFLRMKYGIGLDCWVDIIYNDECLPDDFSLIDVAYTFAWKRTSPMRFAYRIYSKEVLRGIKTQRNFQTPRVDEEEKNKSKYQSTLEQQKQNEYLGNFNLNPTNSNIFKSQNCNKSMNNNNANNNSSSVKNNNIKLNEKDCIYKNLDEFEDHSRDKMFQSSEDSNASGLQIISEKEDSVKEISEDSKGSMTIISNPPSEEKTKRNLSTTVNNFAEDAVDSFCVKKVLRNKHKSEGKKAKRKSEEIFSEKRKKSFKESNLSDDTEKKHNSSKRRKSMSEVYNLKRNKNDNENCDGNEDDDDDDDDNNDDDDDGDDDEERTLGSYLVKKDKDDVEKLGNLKNEALRKVFVTKDKPEISVKKKDGESRRKKRKKSKHHEGETKRRKSDVIVPSPSIMSFAKDALKLKVKLTPNRPIIKSPPAEEKPVEVKETEGGESDKEGKKQEVIEPKKSTTDKERLLHLRAVRHKTIVSKSGSKDYINAPPSLTISKVDSSEQQPVKSTLVESRPSLEIMLVNPLDNSKLKKVELNPEARKESMSPKVDNCTKEVRQRSEVVDNFGVLDLSEKSTRTKENNSMANSNSPSPKEVSDSLEKCRKSTHQSILHIAQTLVNRKLSPILPESHHDRGGFDSPSDSSARAAAMRNLKTLSDTAVNILMAAQNKSFPGCGAEGQKRPFASVSSSVHKPLNVSNSTKCPKDCENGTGLKIPMFPISRERPNPIPPIPNLHEIYPRNRGRPLPLTKSSTPIVKPGQNQTVRQIPNPFVVLNRQTNQNQQQIPKSLSPPTKTSSHIENGDDTTPPKQKLNSIPPLQSIKTKLTLPKLEDLSEINGDKKDLAEFKESVPKLINNNNKTVQNNSDGNFFGMRNGGDERKGNVKINNNTNTMRKIENMAKNIESVAAGLTARAVSNAMIDAK